MYWFFCILIVYKLNGASWKNIVRKAIRAAHGTVIKNKERSRGLITFDRLAQSYFADAGLVRRQWRVLYQGAKTTWEIWEI